MKIGIISDTHGSYGAYAKGRKLLGDCDYYLHAGDVLYNYGVRFSHDQGPAALAEAIKAERNFIIVAGNCDDYNLEIDLEKKVYANIILDTRLGLLHHEEMFDGIFYEKQPKPASNERNFKLPRIYMTHGHRERFVNRLSFAEEKACDVLIYGHSHIKECFIDRDSGILVLNPGSPSFPRDGVPSVAFIDTTKALAGLIDIKREKLISQVKLD